MLCGISLEDKQQKSSRFRPGGKIFTSCRVVSILFRNKSPFVKERFCFILNPIEVEGKLPIELIPGHWFKRASAEQIELIKEKEAGIFEVFSLHAFLYEQDVNCTNSARGAARNLEPPHPARSLLEEERETLLWDFSWGSFAGLRSEPTLD